jgi:uncharacterized membrane protein
MYPFVILLSVVGIIATIGAHACSCKNNCMSSTPDTSLWGIPIPVIGIVGYFLLAVTTGIPYATQTLAILAGIVTIILMVKAYRIKRFCPVCITNWIINFAILGLAFAPPTSRLIEK